MSCFISGELLKPQYHTEEKPRRESLVSGAVSTRCSYRSTVQRATTLAQFTVKVATLLFCATTAPDEFVTVPCTVYVPVAEGVNVSVL